jgi:hypothetical protein
MGRLIFIILIVGIGLTAAYQYGTVEEVTITVTDKERVVKSSGDNVESYYLVFCEEEIFKNDDACYTESLEALTFKENLKSGKHIKLKSLVGESAFFLCTGIL